MDYIRPGKLPLRKNFVTSLVFEVSKRLYWNINLSVAFLWGFKFFFRTKDKFSKSSTLLFLWYSNFTCYLHDDKMGSMCIMGSYSKKPKFVGTDDLVIKSIITERNVSNKICLTLVSLLSLLHVILFHYIISFP